MKKYLSISIGQIKLAENRAGVDPYCFSKQNYVDNFESQHAGAEKYILLSLLSKGIQSFI